MTSSRSAFQTDGSSTVAILVEQITERLAERREDEIESLLARHPEHADRLRELLPAMRLLCNVGAADNADGSPSGESHAPIEHAGTLGDFRIICEIGRGGMGVVYEAEQISLSRRVALKVLPFAGVLDARQLQRFHNESRAAAGLHNEHIVPVYAVGSDRGVHFYAMQYIEGLTLADVIVRLRQQRDAQTLISDGSRNLFAAGANEDPQARLDERAIHADTPPLAHLTTADGGLSADYFRTIANWGVQIGKALDYAHSVGVIHRDVKPANLILDTEGKVWITDFGLAQMETDAGLTVSGGLVGTPRYMSPEQALGAKGVVDQRTDVYSLGTTLYELLTLVPAYSETDPRILLRQIADVDPVLPRSLNREVPVELETIVQKAMRKEPASRYVTANYLAEDLHRFLERKPIAARPRSFLERAVRWRRRNNSIVTGAAIVCFVVACGGMFMLYERAERRSKAIAIVREALEDTAERRGEAEAKVSDVTAWSAAVAAARRAESLAVASPIGVELRQRAADVLAQLQAEASIVHKRLAEDERDQKMLSDLDAVRLQNSLSRAGGQERDYAVTACKNAFREYGIDLEQLSVEEVATMICKSKIRHKLVLAIADVAHFLNEESVSYAPHVWQIAHAATADVPLWERPLVSALWREDPAALQEIARNLPGDCDSASEMIILARGLSAVGNAELAMKILEETQQLYPSDFWANVTLARALLNGHLRRGLAYRNEPKSRYQRAMRFVGAAAAIRPQSFTAQFVLGNALCLVGETEAGIAAYHRALAVEPDNAGTYNNLVLAYVEMGDLDRAMFSHDRARALGGESVHLLKCLGVLLIAKGKPDGAIAAFGRAIELQYDYADAHNNLGATLATNGDVDTGIAEIRLALRFKPDYVDARTNLGIALARAGNLDAAIDELRLALKLNPEYAAAHANLAFAFKAKGNLDDAIAEYHRAIDFNPKSPQNYFGLSETLRLKGSFPESLAIAKRIPEVANVHPQSPHSIAEFIREGERLVRLDEQAKSVLSGNTAPATVIERAELAEFALKHKRLYLTAAQWYNEAFVEDPGLPNNVETTHRFNAACAAALAGSGHGSDAATINVTERACWRERAADWLRADLLALKELAQKPDQRQQVAKTLTHWQKDSDLAGVRDPQLIATRPDAERHLWESLWADVQQLLDDSQLPSKSGD